MLGITWKYKVQNKELTEKTALQKLESIINERRQRWFGHVLQMDDSRQVMHWEADTTKQRPWACVLIFVCLYVIIC